MELLDHLVYWEKQGRLALEIPARGASPESIWNSGNWGVELILPRHGALLDEQLKSGGKRPNPSSAVLRVSCGPEALLIGGDAPLVSWQGLEPDRLPARVVRVPHHGGRIDEGDPDWTMGDLYHRIGAEVSAFSVGTNNIHGHPQESHLEAARRGGACRVLCTQLTGRCHPEPLEYRQHALELCSGVVYPYRHRIAVGDPSRRRPTEEVPCAGSMMIVLDSSGNVEIEPPAAGWHDDLVDRLRHPHCRPR